MIVYANKITSRLKYITDFIGNEIIGQPFHVIDDVEAFKLTEGPKINYSENRIGADELWIINHNLLFEEGSRDQHISCFNNGENKAFFRSEGEFPFDIFAASFYLLSRYEEYLPHKKDNYGRYAHENSLAYKEEFLHLPLINIWLEDLKMILKSKFPSLNLFQSQFIFQPTYDIDEAFAYRHKPIVKNIGGAIQSLLNGQSQNLSQRFKVLLGKEQDPYNAFDWMDQLHRKFNLDPVYFFHVAIEKGLYDKNISPFVPAMQKLISEHATKYNVGIHPSWKTGDDESFYEKEIEVLEKLSERKITKSRQHYIRFQLPQTFRKLISLGIKEDYSMGYGSINGFRASVATSFYWYDLEKEEKTNLLLHPFCFMEANSFFEQQYLPQRAYEEMMHYYNVIRAVNGKMISIWHNSFLGTYPFFQGWKDIYESFIKTISNY